MILCIEQVLLSNQLDEIHRLLKDAEFVEGKLTAGRYAKTVKDNYQLKGDTEVARKVRGIVHNAIAQNPLFKASVRPQKIRPILFNRYEPGMSYGWHTDNAIMGEGELVRSDVSLTLFLSEPDTYQGGELVIDTSLGEKSFKLPAGSMIVYPSTFLHQVTEVTEGIRLAAVTWVQSLVRDVQQREILFELDTVRKSIFEQYGKTVEFDLLCKTHANLLRQWVEL
ncbi:Fe2+-dependent dioxygenase [Laspinema olomoucense]|uniref:Fe2+-dependent dioxygenase n=1 Tax=Laspinema olomoucense D3b TaxID=2953688 RepID=A0ABT2NIZ0_9CYAN|nr:MULTISPECIES: Fe2+-dependent dioxygenase [unclassified Laspinema]MCT7974428.1 Fe2+-dependent dioxygenase [Laspinema sp. D3d]MCT7981261.1 Fe2+-dependent dioxygenase [Laspinema sp. D3b]